VQKNSTTSLIFCALNCRNNLTSASMKTLASSRLLRERFTPKLPTKSRHLHVVLKSYMEAHEMARKKKQAYTEEFRREVAKHSEEPGVLHLK
jgi:hypothetical protein